MNFRGWRAAKRQPVSGMSRTASVAVTGMYSQPVSGPSPSVSAAETGTNQQPGSRTSAIASVPVTRMYQRPVSGTSPIVSVAVTGMHRTGTSMVARMLREGGLWFGDDESFISPASDNPEGFFEHERLVRLDDELLEATGGSWDHPPARGPLAADDPRVAHLSERARNTIGELAGHERWGWKDPRICLTAPFWLDLVPELRFIICVRHPVEVAMSLKRRNQISYALALSLWERYYTALFEAVPPAGRLVTHFGALFDASTREADRLLDFAAAPRTCRSDVLEAINPELRHQRAQVSLADAGVSRTTVELYARLCEEAGWAPEVDVSAGAPVSVHAAVLDLATTKETASRQGRAISVLEGRIGDIRAERDDLVDRVGELRGERDALIDRVRELEDERDRLASQVGTLEKTSLLLGERLAAVETDATASILMSVDERMESLEHGIYHLIDRPGGGNAVDQAVAAGRRAVYDNVPIRAAVLVAGKSDPAFAEIPGRRVTNFPQDASGRYPGFALADSQALVAHLEALRCAGNRFLLVPASSQWLLDHYASFGEYLLERYSVMASDPSFGILADLTDRQVPTNRWSSSVSGVIDRLAAGTGRNLAVLDMTHLHIAGRLPGHNVFSSPNHDGILPYLDSTIDVVVIESDEDLPEATRTAMEAVVRIRPGPGGLPEVRSVELLGASPKDRRRIAVVVDRQSSTTQWTDRLAEALQEEPAAFLATDSDEIDRADMVALIDNGVLPLPSCLSVASGLLWSSDRIGAVAVKILGAYGALDAAGTTLFADGSSAGVGEGSFDVAAAWHEYVRETCWGPGLMLYRAEAVRDLLQRPPGPAAQATWSEHVWRAGYRVLYQPAAAAVLTLSGTDARASGATAVWSPHLLGRPQRPSVLDETAWRDLLAAEDVAGGLQ